MIDPKSLSMDEAARAGVVLDHPDRGVVGRHVAVRVKLPDHVSDDAGALHKLGVRGRPRLVIHHVEDPAVDRLEAVADVRERLGT